MSRLNYNKWDALELSDDSDIETHPNVDKKSMIRWKQRDIQEKRQLRKLKLHHLTLESTMNTSLLLRISSLISSTLNEGTCFISRTIAELRIRVPDYEGRKFAEGEQPSEDHMVLSLLSQVINAIGVGEIAKEGGLEKVVKELQIHEKRLEERQVKVGEEREEEEREQRRHITTDDMHIGFESKTMISDKPSATSTAGKAAALAAAAEAKKNKKALSKSTSSGTETRIETLNSPSLMASLASSSLSPSTEVDVDGNSSSESESDAATLTASSLSFSLIAPLDWTSAFRAISSDPTLLSEETTDALLVEAFSSAMKGQEKRARQCVEKGLLVQYCRELGKDGVAMYFRKMTASDPKALKMFLEDVSATSQRIISRAKIVEAERLAKLASNPSSREQIQLVATDPNTIITFELPSGPPPAIITLEGPDSETLDPILVREFLQKRWDMFEAFPVGLKRALVSKNLEKVNKVLGRMEVRDAERVVEELQEAGILAFESGGIRDLTLEGEGKEEEEVLVD